jgi:hypothetical protein
LSLWGFRELALAFVEAGEGHGLDWERRSCHSIHNFTIHRTVFFSYFIFSRRKNCERKSYRERENGDINKVWGKSDVVSYFLIHISPLPTIFL